VAKIGEKQFERTWLINAEAQREAKVAEMW